MTEESLAACNEFLPQFENLSSSGEADGHFHDHRVFPSLENLDNMPRPDKPVYRMNDTTTARKSCRRKPEENRADRPVGDMTWAGSKYPKRWMSVPHKCTGGSNFFR